MMRKYLLSVVAAAALASPAAARDNSWYVGLEGGAMWLTKIQFDYEFAQFENRRPVDHKLGFDVDLIGGYDFGAFRAEAELGYKRASVDTWGLLDSDTGEGSDVDGRASALSTMINVLADFGASDGVSGYVGGGAGVARVRYRVGDEDFAGGFRDRDNTFAWQVIAGLRTAISPSIDVGLKYRFFHTNRLRFDGTVPFGGAGPFTAEGRWRSHSLLASMIFNFGAPAAAPIPAPASAPPPPPPPPATRTCPDGTVVLTSGMCPAPPPPPPPPPPPMPERG